ncbi:hypothetical protein HMPREF0183_0633 [Brevibacterium mcbrellneri ATCC 49030]|uniref:Uncharacterized protein n=1 Tax=Brevibacterium mcbrellneri ATCC 49030 TaxID=585530 RepID=D4YL23_9MICO|nr:hypothetical protein HMPREF0183_0633 [Brevibacterium mcbrellneri ATCC 49030]
MHDRASAPIRQPTATRNELVMIIETMRRHHKWSASHGAHRRE